MWRVWQAGPLCLFWTIWKIRNSCGFDDGIFSIQNGETSFAFLLWSEIKLSILNGHLTIPGLLIGWVVSE